MDGNAVANGVARLVQGRGQTVTIRRGASTDVVCKASIRDYNATELVGDIRQGDRQCIISNEEILAAAWPGPPSKDTKDRVIIGGVFFTIIEVDTRVVADVVAGHWIRIRGV